MNVTVDPLTSRVPLAEPIATVEEQAFHFLALCRMAVQYGEEGTDVEVGKLDGLQKRIPAKVVPFPFYDPKKERPRS